MEDGLGSGSAGGEGPAGAGWDCLSRGGGGCGGASSQMRGAAPGEASALQEVLSMQWSDVHS